MSVNQKSHADESRWIVIYPAYLNSKKKRVEGRRIPLDKTCENPTVQEIYDVLNFEGLKCKIEKKQYPRELDREPMFLGRVRVQLKNTDGSFVNEKFKSRESLMIHAGTLIPSLKSRTAPSTSAQPAPQKAQGKGKKKKK